MIRDLAGGGDASAPLLKRFCRADTHVALDVRYIHIQSREWNYLGGGGGASCFGPFQGCSLYVAAALLLYCDGLRPFIVD